jgi:hypothetical protein
VLNGSLTNAIFAPVPDGRAAFSLKLSKIDMPSLPDIIAMAIRGGANSDVVLASLLNSLKNLPPLNNGELAVDGSLQAELLNLTSLRLTSSVLGLNGWFKLAFPAHGQRGTCEGELVVSLADALMTAVGDWLPLVTNNALTSNTRNFKVRLTGVECSSPKFGFGEAFVGGMCIRFRFDPSDHQGTPSQPAAARAPAP